MHEMQFDAKGLPLWGMPVPCVPTISPGGHQLPYLHPGIGPVRPTKERPSSMLAWLMLVPFLLIAILLPLALLKLLNRRKQHPACVGLSGWLQSVAFRVFAARLDRPVVGVVWVPVMFPQTEFMDLIPAPIDAGMVEPVFALYSLGVPTVFCCEGHQERPGSRYTHFPYITIAAGKEFPASMLQALDANGVTYEIQASNPGASTGASIYAYENRRRFAWVLRGWAREQASVGLDKANAHESLILKKP